MIPHRIGYRPEIDGLRAIAVMSVIFYHAGLSFIPAGFLGVDIFFVISGYLITNILVADLDEERFSILHFYERRIRRIIPALMLVILLSLVAAYFLMIPDDLENFGQSVVATILFSNNVLLFLTAGYFDLSTEFKPLMHTWSLGVEEHYYIVIPILMWVLFRFGGRRATLIGIAAVSLASFLFSLWAVHAAPTANFYLLPSRAWELGAGGLVALAGPSLCGRLALASRAHAALAIAGLAMIVVPMLVFTRETPMPAAPTLLPVLGTCLVILFAGDRDPVGRLLSTRAFTGIGLISYSAYLFHQPIFAFVRIASLDEPPRLLMVALIPVTLLCAYLSWRWVERPFRSREMRLPALLVSTGSLSAAGLAAGMLLYLTSGFYSSWPELAGRDKGFSTGQNIAYNTRPDQYINRLLPPPSDRANILVIGDSFARDFINMGLETGALQDRNISLMRDTDCPGSTLSALTVENVRRADHIILASAFDIVRARCIAQRVKLVRDLSDAPIAVIGTKSFGWNNNAIMLLDPSTRYVYRAKPVTDVVRANAEAGRIMSTAVYVDILAMLDRGDGRVPAFTPDHMFISQDRAHLTQAGARYLGPMVFRHPALSDLLWPPPSPEAAR